MRITIMAVKKLEPGKGEVPAPQFATAELSGDITIVNELFKKIKETDYNFE